MSPVNPPDPTRCPLCGQANLCPMTPQNGSGESGHAPPPCWCLQASFTDSARAALATSKPFEAHALACICARCAAQP